MFMRVVLPAPFSPSRPWISPGSMVRLMWSFATTPGKPLEISFSSRRTFARPLPAVRPGCPPAQSLPLRSQRRGAPVDPAPPSLRCVDGSLQVVLVVRRDAPVDDSLPELVDLALQSRGDPGIEVVERRDADTVVGEGADVRATLERAVDDGLDGVLDGNVHVLHDAGQLDALVLGCGDEPVGVHPDEHRVAGSLHRRGR